MDSRCGVRLGIAGALALGLLGCSLAPFDPVIGDASVDMDSGRIDGGDVDAGDPVDAGLDAVSPFDAPPGSENCGNGTDDDGDGDVDCQDSDCVDVACVAVPAGWSAPGVLATAAGTPSCAVGGAVELGGRILPEVDAECGSCTCGSPSDSGCEASFRAFSNSVCTLGTRFESASSPGACESTLRGHQGISLVTLSATASCSVTGPASPPVTGRPGSAFGEVSALCSTPLAAGCGAGMACAPIGDGSGHCVSAPGDLSCPAGYPVRRRIHESVDDMRGCTNCNCGVSGTCSSGNLDTYTSTNCTLGALPSFAVPRTACRSLGGSARSFRLTSATPTGVTCDPGGGNSNGCMVPANPITVCCQAGVAPGCPSGEGPAMALIDPDGGAPSYCIDTTEVTRAQYMAFLSAGGPGSPHPGCMGDDTTPRADWPPPPGELDFPVGRVDWCDAHAYCEWAGKRLCRMLDGTTGDGDEGDESDADLSEWTHVCDRTPDSDCDESPYPVRSRACCQSDGVYDLPGGAREWVDNCDGDGDGDDCLSHRRDRCDDIEQRGRRDTNRELGFRCCADAI